MSVGVVYQLIITLHFRLIEKKDIAPYWRIPGYLILIVSTMHMHTIIPDDFWTNTIRPLLTLLVEMVGGGGGGGRLSPI